MKLWEKGAATDQKIEQFTVGQDRVLDLRLAEWDVYGTLAHIAMLEHIGLLTGEEQLRLKQALKAVLEQIKAGDFVIEEGLEDVHSQIELTLTRQLGEDGKKIHSGRSRNDQVLTALKLFLRHKAQEIAEASEQFAHTLLTLSERYKTQLLPGYTHFQVAMPSSFGLWLGAYAESLSDDLQVWQGVYRLINQNPLGSAAGYGSSFPLNRQMTTDLLGFEALNYNVVYAQMTRGKSEKNMAFAMANTAHTLGRLAMDITLYMSQNFDFLSFPERLTTGSSIMPHKKNPDIFELVRAKCNKIQALPGEISLLTANLPSGYHRDWQLLKESLFPAVDSLQDCLEIMNFALPQLQAKDQLLDAAKYDYLFSVEAVNQQVLQGVPFREAYRNIAKEIGEGDFKPDKNINHLHEGSIGNLCNEQIAQKINRLIQEFHFEKPAQALEKLCK